MGARSLGLTLSLSITVAVDPVSTCSRRCRDPSLYRADLLDELSNEDGFHPVLLGERPNVGQSIGLVLTLGDGIATSLLRDNGSSTPSAATESESNLPDDT